MGIIGWRIQVVDAEGGLADFGADQNGAALVDGGGVGQGGVEAVIASHGLAIGCEKHPFQEAYIDCIRSIGRRLAEAATVTAAGIARL